MNTNISCPCGSAKIYLVCCHPCHTGDQPAVDAHALMRSRYCAYALQNYAYIIATYDSKTRASLCVDDIRQHDEDCRWLALEIIRFEQRMQTAEVEFVAIYLLNKQFYKMHEYSEFIVEDNQWRYTFGRSGAKTARLALSRNDSCPCKSGKKIKKCCGS